MPLPKGPRVVIGYHDWGFLTSKFVTSLTGALRYEGARVAGVMEVVSPYVTEARNRIVHKFLTSAGGDIKYLLMVDVDIEFPEDAITQCIYLAEAHQIPVIAGDYALGNAGHSLFAKDPNSEMCQPLAKLEPNTLYREIYGAGTGWLLIRRDVLEKMKTEFPGPWHWFDHDPVEIPEAAKKPLHPTARAALESGPGEFNETGILRMGEDLSFCRRVAKLGFEVAGHTGLRLVHHKQKGFISEELFEAFRDVEGVVALSNPYAQLQKEMEEQNAAGTGGAVEGAERQEATGGNPADGSGRGSGVPA